jgi:hypothetical protein
MKTITIKLLLLAGIIAVLFSCSNDDAPSVNSEPEFVSLEKNISTFAGLTFNLEGEFADPAGIKSINIKYEPWFLDKTILKDSLQNNYDLNYLFKVPKDAIENSQHTIIITVTNGGNVSTTSEVIVTLDKDIVAPAMVFNAAADGYTILMNDGDDIVFDIDVTDDEELSTFRIESDLITEEIAISGTSYNYTKAFDIAEPGIYEFLMTVVDFGGNITEQSVTISVVDELKFIDMYLADVDNDDALNEDLTGIPYKATGSTVVGEEGFVFSINYFASTDNEEVRFIPQKNSFAPFTFGVDPNVDGGLFIGSDTAVAPIILGSKGYYEISMDLRDLTYSVNQYTPPAPEPFGGDFIGVYMAGTGVMVGGEELGGWSPATALAFMQDTNYPHRYTQTIGFIDGVQGQFIFVGNTSNWNKFWRTDAADLKDINSIVPQGGSNAGTDPDDPIYSGTVLVTLDLHLNTFTATKL